MQSIINNQTTGATSSKYRYQDSEIYWTILGRKVAGGDFFYMDPQGTLNPIRTADNTHTVPDYVGEYADYSYKLSDHPVPAFSEQVYFFVHRANNCTFILPNSTILFRENLP